jgi:hypothetical protein
MGATLELLINPLEHIGALQMFVVLVGQSITVRVSSMFFRA